MVNGTISPRERVHGGGLWHNFAAGRTPEVVFGTPPPSSVQPGIIGRCAVEMDAWVRQPSVALFGVGAKVVEDDMGFDSPECRPGFEPPINRKLLFQHELPVCVGILCLHNPRCQAHPEAIPRAVIVVRGEIHPEYRSLRRNNPQS